MRSSPPSHIFDKNPVYDDDWIYDESKCHNCNQAISEHDTKQAVECAKQIIRRGVKVAS